MKNIYFIYPAPVPFKLIIIRTILFMLLLFFYLFFVFIHTFTFLQPHKPHSLHVIFEHSSPEIFGN